MKRWPPIVWILLVWAFLLGSAIWSSLRCESPFVASAGRGPFHRADCHWAAKIKTSQRFYTTQAAFAAGHRPCRVCRP